MQTTIIVKRRYESTGTTKAGKPYTLTKLLAGGKYYSSFKPIAEAIQEGSEVELECDPSEIANTYDIKRIISFSDAPASTDYTSSSKSQVYSSPPAGADAYPTRQAGGSGGRAVEAVNVVQRQADEAPSKDVEARLKLAKRLAMEACPEYAEMSEFPYLVATILNELGSDERQRRMTEMDERKLKAYGRQ